MGMDADEGKKRCKGEPEPGEIEYVDEEMAKAMAHPLRVQILGVLNKRPMSASAFAKTYDEKLPNVSYHFRVLKNMA
jgi:DNA-binding transcriptional ArsR family regulator